MSSRTVIRGGLVITASDEMHADVLIEDGRIAALAASGTPAAEAVTAEQLIDATGKYVIPGGVDGHTHMQMPFGGTTASDTFETGTRAAPWGGTTTLAALATQGAGRAPGGAPPPSGPSRSKGGAPRCAPASTPGTPRPTPSARSTTAST